MHVKVATRLIERACWREHRRGDKPLVLHADNGSAQKAHTLKSKLETLGITPSHSRPGVSDDNAHIESWFRTCKYSPGSSARLCRYRTGAAVGAQIRHLVQRRAPA